MRAKNLNIKQLTEIGFLKRAHGVKGDVVINLNDDILLIDEMINFFFFEIEGLPVPFKVEEFEWRGDNAINVKFKLIENKEEAQTFIGSKIFVEKKCIDKQSDEQSLASFVGFTLIDQTLGTMGPIVQVDDFAGNIVFTVNYNEEEILIPFNAELLVLFDESNEQITLNLPDGLLSIDDDDEDDRD